jgi:hypothetical protein
MSIMQDALRLEDEYEAEQALIREMFPSCKFHISIPRKKWLNIIAGNFMILNHNKIDYKIKQHRPITIKDVIDYLTTHQIEPIGDRIFLEAIFQSGNCLQVYKLFCGS